MPAPALLVLTKPALPGRVKTRLAAAIGAEAASRLQAAFFDDLVARLAGGPWQLVPYWDLDPDEALPPTPAGGRRQAGADLGERLYRAFAEQSDRPMSAAVGSDHPELERATVAAAFAALDAGADVALGPARDGGYYLIALRPDRLHRELFAGISWSTERVLAETLERCRALRFEVARLEPGEDVDTSADLDRLKLRLAARPGRCPRTESLLDALSRLPKPEVPCAS